MTTRKPVPADEWGEAEAYFLGQVIIYDSESIGYFRANAALTWLAEARKTADPPPAVEPRTTPRTYPWDALILTAYIHGLGGAIVGGAVAGPWGIIPGAILGVLIGLGAARPHGDVLKAPIPDRPLPKPPAPPPPPPLG